MTESSDIKLDFWKYKTFEDAKAVADRITTDSDPAEQWIPYDRGSNVWPRYGVCEAPKVGEPVSYEFNGDSYPDGYIATVSKSLRVVTTSGGHRYYRRKLSPNWIMQGGTWCLTHGHCYKQNPEF